MKKVVTLLLSTLNFSYSFAKEDQLIKDNNQIDSKTKEAMHKMNKEVIHFTITNYDSLSNLFSLKLKESVGQDFKEQFIPRIGTLLKGKDFKIYDEFYIENNLVDSPIVLNGGKGEDEYSIKFLTEKGENYFTLLVVGDSSNEIMLSIMYHKQDKKWELSMFRAEDYSLAKMNAFTLFQEARKLRKDGDLIDAVNFMGAATHCATPGGQVFKYKIADHMSEFADTLNFETKKKYPFPYKAETIETKPLIFNIHCELFEGKLVPMIVYQTSIYIKDTNALKAENNELNQKIGQIFKGMDKYNKVIVYRTYNEIPDGKTSPAYYGFIKRRDE